MNTFHRLLIPLVLSSNFLFGQTNLTEEVVQIIPNPLKASSYFHIKVPDGEALKRV